MAARHGQTDAQRSLLPRRLPPPLEQQCLESGERDQGVVGAEIEKIFNESADAVETRLENFPKYVRRQHLTRFLAHYEIFKRIL